MKSARLALAAALAAAIAIGAAPARATLVNNPAAIPAPSAIIDFETYDGLITTGPLTVAPGVIFSGDSGSELGAYIRDLGDNGLWGAGNRFAATSFVGELRFTFDGVSKGAGAFVNHFAAGQLPLNMVVSAYGINGLILETHSVTVSTAPDSYNDGVFVGIARNSADISSISFKGAGLVIDNVAFAAPVPEPGSYALMLAGLALVGSIVRRRGVA